MYLVQAMSEINIKCQQREKYYCIESSYILLYFNDDDQTCDSRLMMIYLFAVQKIQAV